MLKYHMYKKEREIKEAQKIIDILLNGKYTTIAMFRKQEPYIVTLSYGYDLDKNALYFHTAFKGLKIEIIKENSKVCGTVIEDKGYRKNKCSHAYRSIVFWGIMNIIEDIEEKKHAFIVLLNHLEEKPLKLKDEFLNDNKKYLTTNILRLEIKEITAKEGY